MPRYNSDALELIKGKNPKKLKQIAWLWSTVQLRYIADDMIVL